MIREAEVVDALRTFAAKRRLLPALLPEARTLTERIAVREALSVALAASLKAVLVTTDGRLRRGAVGVVDIVGLGE